MSGMWHISPFLLKGGGLPLSRSALLAPSERQERERPEERRRIDLAQAVPRPAHRPEHKEKDVRRDRDERHEHFSLPEADQKKLEARLPIRNQRDLQQILEDYLS